jgi:hypothetical protein
MESRPTTVSMTVNEFSKLV